MDVRELVLAALQTLDIDQMALAKRLGRSPATVSRWVPVEERLRTAGL